MKKIDLYYLGELTAFTAALVLATILNNPILGIFWMFIAFYWVIKRFVDCHQ